MRTPEKESIETLSRNIKLQTPPCINFDFEYLSLLQNAIAAKTSVELEYKNNNQEVSKRLIEPIGLVFYALHWHLIAWCSLRREYRDFKVARILRVKNAYTAFSKTDHIELADYMKNLPVNY